VAVTVLLAVSPIAGCATSRAASSHGHDPVRTTAPNRAATTPTRATVPTTRPMPLAGKVVVLDPGHNGANGSDTVTIDSLVWNGRAEEACDTTGTETDAGYTEALFNWNVAEFLKADLEAAGASVVLTRTSNVGVGPCITQRTAIGNAAHADAALSIHADGGPADGRGFAILEPIPDGPNDAVIGASQELGHDLAEAFPSTGMPTSSYDGVNGIVARDDLAGLNLTSVPKVFIECGNMRNSVDAALLTSTPWQLQAAAAISTGLVTFLTG